LALMVNFLTHLAQQHQFCPPSHHQGPPFSAFSLFANVFLIQYELQQPSVIVVFWTLCYEVVFYAIVGVFLFVARQVSRRPASPTLIHFIFLTGISVTTWGSLIWLIVSSGTCPFPLDRWYQFGLGAMFFLVVATDSIPARQRRSSFFCARSQIFIMGGLILFLASLHPFAPTLGQPCLRLEALTCVIFAGVLGLLYPYDVWLASNRLIQPLLWLGIFSYSLYLIHVPVLPFVDAGLRRWGIDREWYWVTFFVQIAMAILVGRLFYLMAERHFISSRQKLRVEIELRH